MRASIKGFLAALSGRPPAGARRERRLARAPIQPTRESGLLKAHYLSESGAQLIFHNLLPQMGVGRKAFLFFLHARIPKSRKAFFLRKPLIVSWVKYTL